MHKFCIRHCFTTSVSGINCHRLSPGFPPRWCHGAIWICFKDDFLLHCFVLGCSSLLVRSFWQKTSCPKNPEKNLSNMAILRTFKHPCEKNSFIHPSFLEGPWGFLGWLMFDDQRSPMRFLNTHSQGPLTKSWCFWGNHKQLVFWVEFTPRLCIFMVLVLGLLVIF